MKGTILDTIGTTPGFTWLPWIAICCQCQLILLRQLTVSQAVISCVYFFPHDDDTEICINVALSHGIHTEWFAITPLSAGKDEVLKRQMDNISLNNCHLVITHCNFLILIKSIRTTCVLYYLALQTTLKLGYLRFQSKLMPKQKPKSLILASSLLLWSLTTLPDDFSGKPYKTIKNDAYHLADYPPSILTHVH